MKTKYELIDTPNKFELKINGQTIPHITAYKIDAEPGIKKLTITVKIPNEDITTRVSTGYKRSGIFSSISNNKDRTISKFSFINSVSPFSFIIPKLEKLNIQKEDKWRSYS